MEVKTSKPHIVYIWELALNVDQKLYYNVYVRHALDPILERGESFPVLIGVTDSIETDKVYPLNHPNFSELGTSHFPYDPEVSTEGYLRHSAVFPIPVSVIKEVLEFLKQRTPKERRFL
ncbi:MAG: hypothetical protein WCT49_01550 [Candidatus Paceibacterota bacterium]|nr:hypothetical protein [Candidatus Paceibacterota bacterium]